MNDHKSEDKYSPRAKNKKKEKKKGKEVRERRETREFSKSAELFNEEIKISLSPAKRQRRARVVEWLFTRPEKW